MQNADENWENKKLSEIGVEVVRGVTYGKSDIKSSNDNSVFGILRATNITGNKLDLNSLVFVNENLISEKQKLKPLDILITMSSGSKEHIGKNGFYYFNDKNKSFGAFCSKIEIDEKYKFLIATYLQSEQFKTYVKNSCLGTNINNLNNEHIKSAQHLIPNNEILFRFNEIVSKLHSQITNNEIQNQQLSQLRDWLLPMLMNGQIKVE